ncbi:MarR family winged helix-turn-helix transcriptional regulator, partial [Brevundimonas sp.]
SDAVAATYSTTHKLKTPEWRVVAVLAEDGALTPLAIGQRTRMDKVTVSRAAMSLIERGLLRRTPNAADQRSHLLSLSVSGQALYKEVAPEALAVEARIFDGFSLEERQTLCALLMRAQQAAAPKD